MIRSVLTVHSTTSSGDHRIFYKKNLIFGRYNTILISYLRGVLDKIVKYEICG